MTLSVLQNPIYVHFEYQCQGGTNNEFHFLHRFFFHRPPFREGNVFTPVCDSVHSGEGRSVQGVFVEGGLCPVRVIVQGDPSHMVTCGQYASYRNAVLFTEQEVVLLELAVNVNVISMYMSRLLNGKIILRSK